ncbi:MAG: hypothetical protein ACRD2L_06850, partial [Terriglobia bacterium]
GQRPFQKASKGLPVACRGRFLEEIHMYLFDHSILWGSLLAGRPLPEEISREEVLWPVFSIWFFLVAS